MRRLTHFEGLIRLGCREEGAPEVAASSLCSANRCQPVRSQVIMSLPFEQGGLLFAHFGKSKGRLHLPNIFSAPTALSARLRKAEDR